MNEISEDDFVQWERHRKFYIGRVILEVPENVLPTKEWLQSQGVHLEAFRAYYLETKKPRDTISFIVVQRPGKTEQAKCRLLWPRADSLEKIQEVANAKLPSKDGVL